MEKRKSYGIFLNYLQIYKISDKNFVSDFVAMGDAECIAHFSKSTEKPLIYWYVMLSMARFCLCSLSKSFYRSYLSLAHQKQKLTSLKIGASVT